MTSLLSDFPAANKLIENLTKSSDPKEQAGMLRAFADHLDPPLTPTAFHVPYKAASARSKRRARAAFTPIVEEIRSNFGLDTSEDLALFMHDFADKNIMKLRKSADNDADNEYDLLLFNFSGRFMAMTEQDQEMF